MSVPDALDVFEQARQDQRVAASRRSAEVRAQRKKIRAALREKRVDPYALISGQIEQLEPFITGWKLTDLLDRIPGVGEEREFAILVAFRKRPTTKLRDLTPSERGDLAELTRRAVEHTV